ncbi:uncharacterized protein LOC107267174 isoform X2 [Cephus cinctus]|uniref:tRNA (32-2'-O)-methyltransferase regulator THADA n=1 Tax=Cephus cinctus TaxID=211228 RepID=A0AAJ7BU69_CEPCN|nr:uncharacterized protein LOC107267174 isoform X2 [Cephus cinctus]
MEEKNLLQKLRLLKESKCAGDLDVCDQMDGDICLWRNTLDYNVFESYLIHSSKEIRLEALILLVESKKSIPIFTEKELQLIIVFLTNNIGERMDFMPLMKKVLKRLLHGVSVTQKSIVTQWDIFKRMKFVNGYYDTEYKSASAYLLKILTLPCYAKEDYKLELLFTPTKHIQSDAKKLINILIQRYEAPIKLAQQNIVTAIGKHSLYGFLFCVRSLLSICNLREISMEEDWREMISTIIDQCFRLNEAVTQIVNNSSPEGHLPMDLNSDYLNCLFFDPEATTVTPQMVLLCSWRTVKEISLLFGYLIAEVPISDNTTNASLLSEKQIIDIGELFVKLLYETKHRGAFEQAHVGFQKYCTRLWSLDSKSLNHLPRKWLHELLLAIIGVMPKNPKLCATRRSAGIPFMVQALVISDPNMKNTSKPTAISSVLTILIGLINIENEDELISKAKSLMYDGTIFSDLENTITWTNISDFESTSESRLTEMKVHAINILRALFRSSEPKLRTYMMFEDTLIAAIKSYNKNTWAERNAGTLLFSVLIIRCFGVQRTKNHIELTMDNKKAGRTIFALFPRVQDLFLEELQDFVTNDDSLMKPSVHAILLFLSRLYATKEHEDLDGIFKIKEFSNLVSKCAKGRIYKTRELAARALVSLLSENTVKETIVRLLKTITMAPENHLSLNEIHGYLLQLIEIMKNSNFKTVILPETELIEIVSNSFWILTNLECTNNKPACFSVAGAYLNLLTKIHEKDHWRSKLPWNQLFYIVQTHIVQPSLMKQKPGREEYEYFAPGFVMAICTSWSDTDLTETRKNIIDNLWKSLLTYEEIRVQMISWRIASQLLKKNFSSLIKRIVVNRAALIAFNTFNQDFLNSTIQDELYDFLSCLLRTMDEGRVYLLSSSRVDVMCNFIVIKLSERAQEIDFYERPSYFELLGLAYGKLSQDYKEKHITVQRKEIIYETFMNNCYMESAEMDCRISVAKGIRQLYVHTIMETREQHILLYWWTAMLYLLFDDSDEVRNEVYVTISEIEPKSAVECHERMVTKFFEKFQLNIIKRYPAVAVAALFSWCMELVNDPNDELDENGVFDKCRNHRFFDKERILNICNKYLLELVKVYSVFKFIPDGVQKWLKTQLNLQDIEFHRYREFFTQISSNIQTPRVENLFDYPYLSKHHVVFNIMKIIDNQRCHPVAIQKSYLY